MAKLTKLTDEQPVPPQITGEPDKPQTWWTVEDKKAIVASIAGSAAMNPSLSRYGAQQVATAVVEVSNAIFEKLNEIKL